MESRHTKIVSLSSRIDSHLAKIDRYSDRLMTIPDNVSTNLSKGAIGYFFCGANQKKTVGTLKSSGFSERIGAVMLSISDFH